MFWRLLNESLAHNTPEYHKRNRQRDEMSEDSRPPDHTLGSASRLEKGVDCTDDNKGDKIPAHRAEECEYEPRGKVWAMCRIAHGRAVTI